MQRYKRTQYNKAATLRVMCGDSSPYSRVHQVIPAGNVQDRVQGESVREQLGDRIAQVWITKGCE